MVARNLREIIPAFFVGPGGQPLTEEQARTRQELAESLLSQATDTSPTAAGWTSVLAKGVQGLAAGRQRNRAEEGLRLAGERDADLSRSLLSGVSLGPSAATSPLPLGAAPVGAVASQPLDPISQRMSDAHTGGVSPDVVRSGLVQRGLPAHVAEAFVANFQDESGLNPGINEIAPIVPGSRGGYGLYQLTGPRRVAYEKFAQERGVPLDSVDAQLDFLVQELQGPESQAAQRILSAPDTATAAQAIVTDFLRPAPEHRNRRVSQYAGLPNFTAPAQTDDIATMLAYGPQGDGDGGPLAAAPFASAGLPVAPVTEDVIVATTPEEVLAAEMATGMIPDPLSLPENQITMDYVDTQGGAYVDPVVARNPGPIGMGIDPNDPSTIPAMAGGTRDIITELDPAMGYFPPSPSASRGAFPPAPTAQAAASSPSPTGGGASVGGVNPAIIEALSSPYASSQTKQIAGMLLEQQMQAQDPMRALQLEKAQLELEAMRNPQGQKLINAGDGRLYDPNTGQWITAPDMGAPKLSEAEARIQRLTENLMQTGAVVDPQEAQNVAVGIVDGRLKTDRHPLTGELQVVDIATGQPIYGRGVNTQSAAPEGPSAPTVDTGQFGDQFPSSREAFGVGGAAANIINRATDAAGMGPAYPEIQQTQTDFAVLRESLLNDIASTYGRQPPSWLLKEIRELTPEAGSVFQGPEAAQSKLRSLGRHLAGELDNTNRALMRDLSPTNRQELEARQQGLISSIDRLNRALGSFSAPQGQERGEGPQPGQVEDGYRFLGGDPADPSNWEAVQ